jgi:thiol-disulfide isomerase/thioredoxin
MSPDFTRVRSAASNADRAAGRLEPGRPGHISLIAGIAGKKRGPPRSHAVVKQEDQVMRRRTLAASAAVIGALAAGFALALYGVDRVIDRPAGLRAGAYDAAASSTSDAFAFAFRDRPRALPALHFEDGVGRSLSLEDFRGRPVVLNLWATWCVPCRQEMPALDRLQVEFERSGLLVLPLSIDRRGAPAVRQFYRDLGLAALGVYIDRSGAAAGDLRAVGLPTTLLIDRDGHEIGRKIGPAEWDSPRVAALIRDRLGLASRQRQAGRSSDRHD